MMTLRVLVNLLIVGMAMAFVVNPSSIVVWPAESSVQEAPLKEHLVIGSIGSPSILNPYFSADSSSSQVESLLFNGLVTFDPELNAVPDLAESWEVSEDGCIWVFHLRRGVLFHDGVELTAKDVVFSYNIPRKKGYAGPRASDFEKIKEIRAVDRYTVQITLKEPYAPFLSTCTYAVLPGHILENIEIEKLGENEFNSKSPVGTGPYRFSAWKEGQYIKLNAFTEYFRGSPEIRSIYFKIVPDQNAQLLQLQSGGIDFMGIPPTDLAVGRWFEKLGKIRISSSPSLSYTYIGYNLNNPLFQDIRVRQAMTMALNRQLIVNVVLDGQGEVAHTHGSPLSWAYSSPDIPQFPYDVEKAKRLLAEAGWTDTDGDGVLDKDGHKFSFVLMTNQGNKIREMVSQIVQDQWAQVGMEVKPRLMEWSALIHDYVETKKFDAVVLGWSLGVDPDPTSIWHSKEAQGGLNFISYQNSRVDELLEKNTKLMNQEQRKKVLVEIQKIIAQEQPYTFLYYMNGITAYPAALHGFARHPAASFYRVHEWSFR